MRLRHYLLVYLFYLAVIVVITYPLITVIGTRFIGHPFGDAYEYVHHIWWIKTALQTGQNPFFQPILLYPDGLRATLVWSFPLQSFPAWLFAFAMPLPAAFNLAALLTLALNGWAMFFLARYLFTSYSPASVGARHASPLQKPIVKPAPTTVIPALLAGLIFMLYPTFQGQLGAAHTGLLTLWGAPIYLYVLFRLRDTAHVRRTMLAGALLFMISQWGSILLLIYVIAPITAVYLLMLICQRDRRSLRRVLATLVLGAVFSLPFAVPLALDTLGAPRETGSVTYSASLLGVVSPSFYHPLFSGWSFNREVLGVDPFETASYVGVIAAGLALIGVWKRRAARYWLLMALVAWIFSLGPLLKLYDEPLIVRLGGYSTAISLPWALLQNLPLLDLARTPARFNFAVGFAVALMAGYGWATLSGRNLADSARKYRYWLISAALMLAIGFEYQFWWGLPTINGEVPAPIAALADRSDIRAVLDVPFDHPLVNKDGMFLQIGHQHPMIIGQIARASPVNPAKARLLQDTLDPALLDAAGVDIVIVHKDYEDSEGTLGALARTRFGDPFYEDDDYSVFQVPPYHGDAPGFTAVA